VRERLKCAPVAANQPVAHVGGCRAARSR
jgi:hypothetical protein